MRFDLSTLGGIRDLAAGTALSGPELAAEVARRAALFASLELRPGRVAILAHGGTPDFFADLLAVWQTGACAACVNPELTPAELANLADFTAAAVLLVGETPGPLPDLAAPVVCSWRERPREGAASPAHVSGGIDDPALILFTSGTTGAPKGVVHSFRALLARLASNEAAIGRNALRRSLSLLPTYFGHGLVGNGLTPLFCGGELFLDCASTLQACGRLGDTLSRHAITFMSSVPALWRIALKASRPPAESRLARLHIGSAPLAGDLWRQVESWSGAQEVVNAYGLTETANWVAGASSLHYRPADGLVGRPWGGRAAVAAEDGSLAAAGEGELLLQSAGLMTGYYRRDDLTQAAVEDGWYRTGDLARIDGDGTIVLIGRRKHEINRAGIKVQPEEVDLLLERHPAVAEACCFGLADPVAGELVAAAICLAEGRRIDGAALAAWCRKRIRRESVPERWFFLERLPRNARGKFNREAVREACLAGVES